MALPSCKGGREIPGCVPKRRVSGDSQSLGDGTWERPFSHSLLVSSWLSLVRHTLTHPYTLFKYPGTHLFCSYGDWYNEIKPNDIAGRQPNLRFHTARRGNKLPPARKVVSDQTGASLKGDFPALQAVRFLGELRTKPVNFLEQMASCIPQLPPSVPSLLYCTSLYRAGPTVTSLRRGTTDSLREQIPALYLLPQRATVVFFDMT